MSVAVGLGWIALAVRLPAWLAARTPGPIACTGVGLTRAARERARDAAIDAARELLG